MKYQAIIFDMDGVIVDSEPHHEAAYREMFNDLGYGENHGINFADYLGRTDKALLEEFIARHKPAHTLEHLSDWKKNRFLDIVRREEPIFEDLPEMVERLSKRYRMAVASGSVHPVINAVLALKNLRQHFEFTVSASDVPHGKPAPDIFLRAAELLEVPPSACCVVEDSGPGVRAAIAARMDVIAITNSLPREKLAGATWVVDRYDEIDRLLLGQAV